MTTENDPLAFLRVADARRREFERTARAVRLVARAAPSEVRAFAKAARTLGSLSRGRPLP